ncbi:carbohydrate-binding protein [Streptomyces roseolus]|uniref:carbohydrate-binding protein n=1 Tax=Streptomyces roseolus TaxID=67358 RepID=UPI0016734954|nr:carbohydrate-binding protein [Streptomyces roseolus]GGR50373.1 hypothetical protein GCM10010282_48990 [Streptomyces roseolus]
MAAGNDGANKPEDDDPFGYLYADGQAPAGGRAPQGGGYGYPRPAPAQPGVPRTSYNQVRTVGERQYGQQPAQPYVPPQQQAPYGQQHQPHPQYAAPETYGNGQQPPRHTPPPQPPRGGGRGPNTKGLLIGAVAVVAVVVAGITAAIIGNQGDKKEQTAGGPTTSSAPVPPSQDPTTSTEPTEEPTKAPLPKQDAASLTLGGVASVGTEIKGAKGPGGSYVSLNGVGGSASWTVDVPEAGDYTLKIIYSVPGKDADAMLTVNGNAPYKVNMKNYALAPEGDWEKGWTNTYGYTTLDKGSNSLKISCEQGNACEAIIDQVYLVEGKVGS